MGENAIHRSTVEDLSYSRRPTFDGQTSRTQRTTDRRLLRPTSWEMRFIAESSSRIMCAPHKTHALRRTYDSHWCWIKSQALGRLKNRQLQKHLVYYLTNKTQCLVWCQHSTKLWQFCRSSCHIFVGIFWVTIPSQHKLCRNRSLYPEHFLWSCSRSSILWMEDRALITLASHS